VDKIGDVQLGRKVTVLEFAGRGGLPHGGRTRIRLLGGTWGWAHTFYELKVIEAIEGDRSRRGGEGKGKGEESQKTGRAARSVSSLTTKG